MSVPRSTIDSRLSFRETVLSRGISSQKLESTPLQNQIDGMVGSFIAQASDWKSLAAMTAGGLAYRWGRISILNAGALRESSLLTRPLSVAFGLSSEVTAFEFTHRSLQSVTLLEGEGRGEGGRGHNLWAWSGPGGLKEGWLTSLITFGTLKGFGKLAESQNLLVQHGFQDLGMVWGHQLVSRAGLGERPEGTFGEQFLHAEATNLQLGVGTALGHAMTDGKILSIEKGLDLSFYSQQAASFLKTVFFSKPPSPLKPALETIEMSKAQNLPHVDFPWQSAKHIFEISGRHRMAGPEKSLISEPSTTLLEGYSKDKKGRYVSEISTEGVLNHEGMIKNRFIVRSVGILSPDRKDPLSTALKISSPHEVGGYHLRLFQKDSQNGKEEILFEATLKMSDWLEVIELQEEAIELLKQKGVNETLAWFYQKISDVQGEINSTLLKIPQIPSFDISRFREIESLKEILRKRDKKSISNVLRAIEVTMAFAELDSKSNPEFMRRLQDPQLWDESITHLLFSRNIRPIIHEAFSSFLDKLKDSTFFSDESKWKSLQEEFLFYCYALSIVQTGPDRPVVKDLQRLLVARRALARLITLGRPLSEINYWMDQIKNFGKQGEDFRDLYEDLIKAQGAYDPYQILSYERIPKQISEFHNDWMKSQKEPRDILKLLDKIRLESLKNGDLSLLQEVMGKKIDVKTRLGLLKKALTHLQARSDRNLMPIISRTERRPVIWNPLSLESRMVIHPTLGEGRLVEKHGGMVTVQFPEGAPVRVLESVVAFPHEQEKFKRILVERTEKYAHLPYFYPVFEWNRFFASKKERIGVESYYFEKDEQRRPRPTVLDQLTLSSGKASPVLRNDFSEYLRELAKLIGIDPIAFSLRMMIGEFAHKTISETSRHWIKSRFENRIFTPDLIREFILKRPWQEKWLQEKKPGPPNAQAAGYLYPSYYSLQKQRPHDLGNLYYDFRAGAPKALEKASVLIRPLVETWMNQPTRAQAGLIVPMIGKAPNEELARRMGYPVVFPWLPRPQNYGEGVEGERASVKMQMVQAALNLNPEHLASIQGKSILILDDNGTDFITYIWARKLLLDAGAKEVGLVVLTETIRNPRELVWSIGPNE